MMSRATCVSALDALESCTSRSSQGRPSSTMSRMPFTCPAIRARRCVTPLECLHSIVFLPVCPHGPAVLTGRNARQKPKHAPVDL